MGVVADIDLKIRKQFFQVPIGAMSASADRHLRPIDDRSDDSDSDGRSCVRENRSSEEESRDAAIQQERRDLHARRTALLPVQSGRHASVAARRSTHPAADDQKTDHCRRYQKKRNTLSIGMSCARLVIIQCGTQ